MTNDAPERIWADPPQIFDDCDVWHSEPAPKRTEYIRADHAQAEKEAAVAAEQEACAEAVEDRAKLARSKPDWCITAPVCEAEALRCAYRIRSRANTDALAARAGAVGSAGSDRAAKIGDTP